MYKIATLEFDIYNLNRDRSVERLIPFLENGKNAEFIYKLEYCFDFKKFFENRKYEEYDSVWICREKRKIICAYHHKNQVFAVCEEVENTVMIHLLNSCINEEWHYYFLLDLLHLERPLLKKNCFVLHSAFITAQGKAILFTAPSGGGKSTQARMWVSEKKARIINGDKAVAGKEGNQWFAYGLPISGSSPYYLNEKYPIKAIVILQKSADNKLYRVGIRGFTNIFSQIILNNWDAKFCEKAMDLVMEVCQKIPVYVYQCTKETKAVDVLYQELFG